MYGIKKLPTLYDLICCINENLEDVGATMGISRWSIIKDVLLPQSTGTVLEMMSYFFVNCMMTISAVSFLANSGNKPLALMITQFEGQMQLECAAFVSLVILVVNVAMKYIIFRTKVIFHFFATHKLIEWQTAFWSESGLFRCFKRLSFSENKVIR